MKHSKNQAKENGRLYRDLAFARRFQAGQNFGRKGKRKNLCFLKLCTDQHDEEHDDEGQSGSDAPAENTDHGLPILNAPAGVNIKSFLEIQTNGSCGD